MAEAGDAQIELLRAAIEHVSVRRQEAARAEEQLGEAYRSLMLAVIPIVERMSPDEIRGVLADPISDVDRAILRGLDQGLSREVLHTRLGVPRRQIDDRIPELHKLAGTKTPFQLGRAASALGWLTARS